MELICSLEDRCKHCFIFLSVNANIKNVFIDKMPPKLFFPSNFANIKGTIILKFDVLKSYSPQTWQSILFMAFNIFNNGENIFWDHEPRYNFKYL